MDTHLELIKTDKGNDLSNISQTHAVKSQSTPVLVTSDSQNWDKWNKWAKRYQQLEQKLDELTFISTNESYDNKDNDNGSVQCFKNRIDTWKLKMSLVIQQKNFLSISDYFKEIVTKVDDYENSLKQSSKGSLLIQNTQLQKTVRDLSKEVESLSITNSNLLDELKTHSFFDKYYEALKSLSKVQEQHESLLNLKIHQLSTSESATRPHSSLSLCTARPLDLTSAFTPEQSEQCSSQSYLGSQVNVCVKVPSVKIPKKEFSWETSCTGEIKTHRVVGRNKMKRREGGDNECFGGKKSVFYV